MPVLNWKGKKESKEFTSKNYNVKPFHILDIYPSIQFDPKSEDNWQNLLVWGDNKEVMNKLLEEFENKISLIYIDPPFGTGGEFNLKIQIGDNGKYIDNIAYKDKWKDGIGSYLSFIYERLILMKDLLSNEGSIYIHLDWHVSHYLRVILDEIFGNENFRNEIIWAYPAASAKTKRFFVRSYDTLLFYSKSNKYTFNDNPKIYMEYSNRVKNALKRDDKGIFYYRGGSHDGKKLSRKVYVEHEGVFPRDVWNDIPYIRANTSEYQGFSTQKPERLLKRIILASSNKNDLIADFFCGSGTTLAVAEKLERRWIGCDLNRKAIHMSRKRILNISKSNDIMNWKELYQKSPRPFKIITLEKKYDLPSIPNEFLASGTQSNEILKQIKTPKLDVTIRKHNREIIVELLNYSVPFINIISKKVKEKITSFSDWID
ncbi:hypothetical protein LCGC14_1669000, partial [marine sediment metagenome]